MSARCQVCAQLSSKQRCLPGKGSKGEANAPQRLGKPDITETWPAAGGQKHLLVFKDTFPGWVRVFPTCTETAQNSAKKLLQELTRPLLSNWILTFIAKPFN